MPSTPARLVRPLAAAGPLLAVTAILLAGCDSDPDRFPPPCPQPTLPRDTSDLHRFRGNGRDITDTILEGRITDIHGSCKRDTRAVTVTTVSISLELTRGPAAPGRAVHAAYYIAVADGDTILDKQVYPIDAEFPPNTERLRLVGDELELNLPTPGSKTAAAYRIIAGFQLTPAELDLNRTLARR